MPFFDGIRNQEISTASMEGVGYRRLTKHDAWDINPVWSPDGTHIAFFSTRKTDEQKEQSENDDIWWPRYGNVVVMSLDGSNPRIVTGPVGTTYDPPVWSPDSLMVAFLSHEKTLETEPYYEEVLYTVGADGGELRRVSKSTFRPAWSPDGARIAFGVEEEQTSRIYTARPNGSDIQEVTKPGRYRHISGLSWSPDSSEIRFVAARVGPPEEGPEKPVTGIHVVKSDGSRDRIIAELDGLYPVAWSPDDSRIAVFTDLRRTSQNRDAPPADYSALLFSIATDGSDVQVLVRRGIGGIVAEHSGWREIDADLAACAAGFVVPEPGKNPGLVRDCETLILSRNALAGEEVPLLWNADTPISDWPGVEVRGDPPRVRKLGFDKELAGTIPSQLGDLESLEYLGIRGGRPSLSIVGTRPSIAKHLSGSIPPELGNLTKLAGLELNNNRLTGSIPSELGGLANLKRLRLHRNGLSGNIPPELGRLTNLEGLSLGANQLTGNIPPELGRLPHLESLNLKRNKLTGCIPGDLLTNPSLNADYDDGLAPC